MTQPAVQSGEAKPQLAPLSAQLTALGFLTVVEHEQHGLFGGYLVLNAIGRPLEFHCTAPLKPNRAQQILYGPTLAPYLYGEQIGQALASKAKNQPPLILTDLAPVLALTEHVDVPVALARLAPAETAQATNSADARLTTVRVGGFELALKPGRMLAPQLIERLQQIAEQLDLVEPFQRIRDALTEAQRAAA